MMATAVELIPGSGLTTAVCTVLEVSRASVQQHRTALTAPPRATKPRTPATRALRTTERDQVLAHLRTPRFADERYANKKVHSRQDRHKPSDTTDSGNLGVWSHSQVARLFVEKVRPCLPFFPDELCGCEAFEGL